MSWPRLNIRDIGPMACSQGSRCVVGPEPQPVSAFYGPYTYTSPSRRDGFYFIRRCKACRQAYTTSANCVAKRRASWARRQVLVRRNRRHTRQAAATPHSGSICTGCRQKKPAHAFYSRNLSDRRPRPYCKACGKLTRNLIFSLWTLHRRRGRTQLSRAEFAARLKNLGWTPGHAKQCFVQGATAAQDRLVHKRDVVIRATQRLYERKQAAGRVALGFSVKRGSKKHKED